jgi:hypothetical protein
LCAPSRSQHVQGSMVCSSAVEFGTNIPLELPQSLQQDVGDAGASSFTRQESLDVSDLNVGTTIQNTRYSLEYPISALESRC